MSTRKQKPKVGEKSVIKLPPDQYHALHFSSLVYGGIGADAFTDGYGRPLCVHGHLRRLYGPVMPDSVVFGRTRFLVNYTDNDNAVRRVNERKGKPKRNRSQRITFEEWCAELNVVPAE